MTRTERLKRLRELLWLLEKHPDGRTVLQLSAELHISPRTVRRDLLALRSAGYPLASAQGQWGFVQGEARPAAIVSDGPPRSPDRDRVRMLDRAVRRRLPIQAQYLAPGPGGPVHLDLLPLALRFFEGSLFLVAREQPLGQLRTVPVERLDAVRVQSVKPFPSDIAEGLDGYLSGRLERDAARHLTRVVVHFLPQAAWRVQERIWHPSQRVRVEPDGSVLATLRVASFTWVMSWVLGFGSQAWVVAPSALVQAMVAEITAMHDRYRLTAASTSQLDLFDEPK